MFLFSFVDLLRFSTIFVVTYLLFGFEYGVFAPAIAYLVTPLLLSIFFTFIFLKKVFPSFLAEKTKISKNILNKLFRFGIPLLLTSAGGIIITYTDTIILTYFTTLRDVGLYNVAVPTARLVVYLANSVALVVLPLSSELYAKKLFPLLREGTKLLHKYAFIIIIPFTFIIFAYSDLLIDLLFGSEYISANSALKILLIGVLFFSIANVNFSLLTGIGKPILVTKMMLTVAIFNLVSNLIIIPLLGIIGASITTSVGYILLFIWSMFYVKNKMKIGLPLKDWSKTFFAALIFLLSVSLLKKYIETNLFLEILIVLGISILIYVILLFIFAVINKKDIMLIKERIFHKGEY